MSGELSNLDPRPGQEPVPGYTLLREIGRGANTSRWGVWEAKNKVQVSHALKFIELDHKGGEREYLALKELVNRNHPNLATIHDFWFKDQEGNQVSVPDAMKRLDELRDSRRQAKRARHQAKSKGSDLGDTLVSTTPNDSEDDSLASTEGLQRRPAAAPPATDATTHDDDRSRETTTSDAPSSTESTTPSLSKVLNASGEHSPIKTPVQLIVAMDLGDTSLEKHVRTKVERKQLLNYIEEAARAIDYLNQECGLQHRDIKPGNILLVSNSAVVCDCGLARPIEEQDHTQTFMSDRRFEGTLGYCAPEQHPQSKYFGSFRTIDQFPLAVTYYELLTGQLPYPNCSDLFAVGADKLKGHFKLVGLGPAERRVLKKAMSLDPEARYPNCRAFAEALRRACEEDRGRIKRRVLQAVSAMVVVVAIVGVILGLKGLQRAEEKLVTRLVEIKESIGTENAAALLAQWEELENQVSQSQDTVARAQSDGRSDGKKVDLKQLFHDTGKLLLDQFKNEALAASSEVRVLQQLKSVKEQWQKAQQDFTLDEMKIDISELDHKRRQIVDELLASAEGSFELTEPPGSGSQQDDRRQQGSSPTKQDAPTHETGRPPDRSSWLEIRERLQGLVDELRNWERSEEDQVRFHRARLAMFRAAVRAKDADLGKWWEEHREDHDDLEAAYRTDPGRSAHASRYALLLSLSAIAQWRIMHEESAGPSGVLEVWAQSRPHWEYLPEDAWEASQVAAAEEKLKRHLAEFLESSPPSAQRDAIRRQIDSIWPNFSADVILLAAREALADPQDMEKAEQELHALSEPKDPDNRLRYHCLLARIDLLHNRKGESFDHVAMELEKRNQGQGELHLAGSVSKDLELLQANFVDSALSADAGENATDLLTAAQRFVRIDPNQESASFQRLTRAALQRWLAAPMPEFGPAKSFCLQAKGAPAFTKKPSPEVADLAGAVLAECLLESPDAEGVKKPAMEMVQELPAEPGSPFGGYVYYVKALAAAADSPEDPTFGADIPAAAEYIIQSGSYHAESDEIHWRCGRRRRFMFETLMRAAHELYSEATPSFINFLPYDKSRLQPQRAKADAYLSEAAKLLGDDPQQQRQRWNILVTLFETGHGDAPLHEISAAAAKQQWQQMHTKQVHEFNLHLHYINARLHAPLDTPEGVAQQLLSYVAINSDPQIDQLREAGGQEGQHNQRVLNEHVVQPAVKLMQRATEKIEQLAKSGESGAATQVVEQLAKLAEIPAGEQDTLKEQIAKLYVSQAEWLKEKVAATQAAEEKDQLRIQIRRAYQNAHLWHSDPEYLVQQAYQLVFSKDQDQRLDAIRQLAEKAWKADPGHAGANGLMGYLSHDESKRLPTEERISKMREALDHFNRALQKCDQAADANGVDPAECNPYDHIFLLHRSQVRLEWSFLENQSSQPNPDQMEELLKGAERDAGLVAHFPDRSRPEEALIARGNALEDLGFYVGRHKELQQDYFKQAIEQFEQARRIASRAGRSTAETNFSLGRVRYRWIRRWHESGGSAFTKSSAMRELDTAVKELTIASAGLEGSKNHPECYDKLAQVHDLMNELQGGRQEKLHEEALKASELAAEVARESQDKDWAYYQLGAVKRALAVGDKTKVRNFADTLVDTAKQPDAPFQVPGEYLQRAVAYRRQVTDSLAAELSVLDPLIKELEARSATSPEALLQLYLQKAWAIEYHWPKDTWENYSGYWKEHRNEYRELARVAAQHLDKLAAEDRPPRVRLASSPTARAHLRGHVLALQGHLDLFDHYTAEEISEKKKTSGLAAVSHLSEALTHFGDETTQSRDYRINLAIAARWLIEHNHDKQANRQAAKDALEPFQKAKSRGEQLQSPELKNLLPFYFPPG